MQVWVLGMLAASPELHAWVHHDAEQSGHTCAVTLFSHGLDNPTLGAALRLAPCLIIVAEVAPTEPQRVESAKDWQLPGRGPPVR